MAVGGNAAIDWTNELEPIVCKVYVTYRKDRFTGHEAVISQLRNSSAICYFNTTTGKVARRAIDDIVINHGYERDKSLLDRLIRTI